MSELFLELTAIEPTALLDTDTFDAYSNGDFDREMIEVNRQLYQGLTEINVNGIYFATTKADIGEFIHPYRVAVRRKLYFYAFVGYDQSANKLYWFFQGVSRTSEREKAAKIYKALVGYCESSQPNIKPYMIKK
jgi:hypothetical protein